MKIKFDAQKLVSQIHLAKSALPSPRGISAEESLGIRADKAEGRLIVYAYSKGQWVRIEIFSEVEEEGTIFVNRQRFFNLLGMLKGEIKLQTSGTQVKLTTDVQAGKFTMVTSASIVPKPHMGVTRVVQVEPRSLLRQLQQCTLNEELVGGGFKVSFGPTLDILSTDRVRLIDTHQKHRHPEKFEMLISSESIKGVTEILKIATERVTISVSPNITSWSVIDENGSFEYGSINVVVPFPNVKRITEAEGYPNHATLEVADLLEAVKRVTVLADDELAWGDFDFSSSEACVITTETVQGFSEVVVDANETVVGDESMAVLRMQLNHVQSFMMKAEVQKVEYILIEWGTRMPVKFTPQEKELEIDVIFICAALQRPVAKEASV